MGLNAVVPGERAPGRGLRLAPTVVLTSAAPTAAAQDPGAGTPEPPRSSSTGGGPGKGRTRTYLAVGLAFILVMVLVAYAVIGEVRPAGSSGSSGTVLIPNGTGYSLVIGAFNGVNFVVSQESRITGTFNSSHGVQVYVLTPAEFQSLVKSGNVSEYVWTSGVVADQTVYQLDVTVQPGQWVLAFVNPNVSWPTGVGFYSDVVLVST